MGATWSATMRMSASGSVNAVLEEERLPERRMRRPGMVHFHWDDHR
jgi:hypothetical protein